MSDMLIAFVHPETFAPLKTKGEYLVDGEGSRVAVVRDGIPRFVTDEDNYADSFGWQWNYWQDIRSGTRSRGIDLKNTVLQRTHFDEFDLEGKSILECGMGGGDDTEVLLQLPFAQVHAFDLSNSVDRAKRHLRDERLVISQASIYQIPYPDAAFDVVYCHRVLQHTPDPVLALRKICRKVKPGGLLFAHAYKKSIRYMMEWRYKYRWITKRMDRQRVFDFINAYGARLHALNRMMYRTRLTRLLAYNFVPFFVKEGTDLPEEDMIELEKLITFDALTPWHDHPMRPRSFFGVIEQEGFTITHKVDPAISPMWCTAVKDKAPS